MSDASLATKHYGWRLWCISAPQGDIEELVQRPPEKLSELVRLVIKDGRGLDPAAYKPNAETWHVPDGGVCSGCLAGAVMAGTLGLDHRVGFDQASWVTGHYAEDSALALRALDEVRMGSYAYALELLYDFREGGRYPDVSGIEAPECSDFKNFEEFEQHLCSLAVRFARGERTPELLNEITDLE